MDAKIIILIICSANYICCAGLLRKPKIYNAVITTDDNLAPSRAFPVIQPTIHETGITTTYPYGPFNPYRFFNPSLVQYSLPHEERFHEIPLGIIPREEPVNHHQMPPLNSITIANNNDNQNRVSQEEGSQPQLLNIRDENQPNLITSYHSNQQPEIPINLQPFPNNRYPLIYDDFTQYQDQYLPPFGYAPQSGYGIPTKTQSVEASSSSDDPKETKKGLKRKLLIKPTEIISNNNSNLDSIKNGIENKNSEVPDVPPPPVPN